MRTSDRRELGLRLTRLANASVTEVLAMTSDAEPTAARIGLTGAPGSGKSSLGGRLAIVRGRHKRIGLLAIDPSSPRSGGAILGDRIRMDELEDVGDLYVRSIASRSASNGLADNLPELLQAMDAAGFDELILETVGIGQAEHAARTQVDTLVLVLVPQAGDIVQAMKAGIMELADLYVVHKSDLAGAERQAADVRRIVHASGVGIASRTPGWTPPVVLTSTGDPASVERLSHEIDRHQAWLAEAGDAKARRLERARYRLRSLLERKIHDVVHGLPEEFFNQPLAGQLAPACAALADVTAYGMTAE